MSSDDLMSLASERGSTPLQVGAVLMLDGSENLEPGLVVDAIADRVCAVPRLRQRLVEVPLGCGRPVWVDDVDFTVSSHFSVATCPAPGDESAVLGVAAEMLLTRLPRDRPLWAAKLVTGTGGGGAALIVVFHHVLADGIGGLAVLAGLVDGAANAHVREFPVRRPSRALLAVQAANDRMRSAGRLPAGLGRLAGAASQLRPVFGRRLARSSLNKATGPRRRFATVRVDLDQIRGAAHAHEATVNDVVLSAIAVALHRLLLVRGERVDEFVISVPFSARRQASAGDLGNQSGVIPMHVQGVGDPARRLELLAVASRAAKQAQRGASTALLGPFFRLLAAAGLFRWFIDRQRLIHTFVSNLRGPESRLTFLGFPITSIIPLSAASGNVTVSFAVLSYAGSLTITLIADPETCPDLSDLRNVLEEEVRVLTASTHY
ncbi:MAG: wax ester/triacylglycerol synthase domain-containing protein [Dermatophilaceae bacterium]